MTEWYYSAVSQWTLDYPPFFAHFEWFLARAAQWVDRGMLRVEAVGYESEATVLFQRLTVIASDALLFAGVLAYVSARGTDRRPERNDLVLALVLVAFSPGLLIVDHIHFQYNGMLLGIFLLSLAYIRKGQDLMGGLLFAVLLNFKHIFLYVAPLYFIYLLRRYCFRTGATDLCKRVPRRFIIGGFDVGNLFVLGVCVLAVFAVSFGPFLWLGGSDQISQIFSRLFPFGDRGLCHAYWAPNFWALYNAADKALEVVAVRAFGIKLSSGDGVSMTGGLVENFSHAVLPRVFPIHTVILTLLAMAPVLVRVWVNPRPKEFAGAAGMCILASFMFGWHVHEKAILTAVIPLAMHCIECVEFSSLFWLIQLTAHASLFPLLFGPQEAPVKVALVIAHSAVSYVQLRQRVADNKRDVATGSMSREPESSRPFFFVVEGVYVGGLALVQTFEWVLQPILLPSFPFLPLMLWSMYCAVGLLVFHARLVGLFCFPGLLAGIFHKE